MSSQKQKERLEILPGRLEQGRLEANLTQPQLAKLLGKSKTWLSMRENGRRPLYRADLEQIARLLHKPVAWFLTANPEQDGLLWKARQYDNLLKEIERVHSLARNRHYTEMSDAEIDRELERLGITDPRFQALFKSIPLLCEKERERIWRAIPSSHRKRRASLEMPGSA